MKIQAYLDNMRFTQKPTTTETGAISKRIIKTFREYDLEKYLKELALNGRTTLLAEFDGERTTENFYSQKIFMLDFDNKVDGKRAKGSDYIKYEDILENEFIKNNAVAVYKTFSNKENWNRFRAVFIVEEEVYDLAEVKEIYEFLLEKFEGKADAVTKDVTRLFYGGKEKLDIIDINNKLSYNINRHYQLSNIITGYNTNEKVNYGAIEDIVEMIREDDIEGLRDLWSDYTDVEVLDYTSAVEYMKSLSLYELFELPKGLFNDIIGGDDKNPSASIFINDEGHFIYKSFRNNENTGSILNLIASIKNEKLAEDMQGSTRYAQEFGDKEYNKLAFDYSKGYKWLKEVLNIKISENEQTTQTRMNYEEIINALVNEEYLQTNPNLKKVLRSYKQDVADMLSIFNEYQEYNFEGEYKVLSYLSTRRISNKIYGHEKSNNKVSKLINLMALIGLIEKVDINTLGKDLQDKIKGRHDRHSNIISLFNGYKLSDLSEGVIAYRLQVMADANFILDSITYEMVRQTFGEELAQKIFPQDRNNETSNEIMDDTQIQVVKIIYNCISEFGYATENMVQEIFAIEYGRGKQISRRKYKQVITSILQSYDLQITRANKEMKEEFGIGGTSSPSVIIPN